MLSGLSDQFFSFTAQGAQGKFFRLYQSKCYDCYLCKQLFGWAFFSPVDVLFLFYWLQGLSDTEEFVVCKALNALTCLAELGLLQKPTLQELVSQIVPFLCHPVSQHDVLFVVIA